MEKLLILLATSVAVGFCRFPCDVTCPVFLKMQECKSVLQHPPGTIEVLMNCIRRSGLTDLLIGDMPKGQECGGNENSRSRGNGGRRRGGNGQGNDGEGNESGGSEFPNERHLICILENYKNILSDAEKLEFTRCALATQPVLTSDGDLNQNAFLARVTNITSQGPDGSAKEAVQRAIGVCQLPVNTDLYEIMTFRKCLMSACMMTASMEIFPELINFPASTR